MIERILESLLADGIPTAAQFPIVLLLALALVYKGLQKLDERVEQIGRNIVKRIDKAGSDANAKIGDGLEAMGERAEKIGTDTSRQIAEGFKDARDKASLYRRDEAEEHRQIAGTLGQVGAVLRSVEGRLNAK